MQRRILWACSKRQNYLQPLASVSLRPHRGQIPVVAGACGASSCLHPVTLALPQAPPNPEMFQWKVKALLTGSCLTTCSPPDCGLPGSSVRGILQAGVLERAAMPSSKGIFPIQGSNLHVLCVCTADSCFISEPPGKPLQAESCP